MSGVQLQLGFYFSKRAYATRSIAFVLDLHKGQGTRMQHVTNARLASLSFPGRGLDAKQEFFFVKVAFVNVYKKATTRSFNPHIGNRT